MKKVILFLFSLFFFCYSVYADDFDITGEYVTLYNMNEDTLLYSKNDTKKTSIASLTKMMTTLVAIEEIDNLDKIVTIKEKDFEGIVGYSKAGFKVGDKVTYRDLLYGIILPSGADAVNAVVNNTLGYDKFIKKMNETAKKIGMNDTSYANPIGKDDENNYSTSNDLAKLLKYALKNKTFKTIFTTKNYKTSNGLNLESTVNRYENILNTNEIKGAKSGFTKDAGRCLASITTLNNVDYLLVVINSSTTSPYNAIKDTITILKGIRDKYEAHHKVKITDEAIKAAVELSSRYINDRYLPDKAIDLMDEAASKVKLASLTAPKEVKKIEEKIGEIVKEKEDAINVQDFEKAAKLRDKEQKEKEKLEKVKLEWEQKNQIKETKVTEEDIAGIVSNWTGVPVVKLTEAEADKLKNLEAELHKRVIGQDEAIVAVAKAIRRGRVGLKDPNRPIGSFLFLGPTGVGKTELSKALAESLFGNEDAMIRIDMSEYMEGHSVSKLIGSPPGYVGFDDGGQLTEKIRRKPYSVILFDEIEKAHPDVMNMLLQILDDGRLTDAQGRTVNFKNTVIIMTSNIGARLITDKTTLGFSAVDKKDETQKEYESIKKDVMGELKKQFRPEFINRIDEIIVFHKLNNEDIKQIIDIMINQVTKRMQEKGYNLEIEDSVKELIAKKGIDTNYGARPLKRAIQNILEDRVAEEILDGNIKQNKKAIIKAEDDKIVIK